MVAEVLDRFKDAINKACLLPSSGGIFEIRLDGRVLFSKTKQQGRFPEAQEAVHLIEQAMRGEP